MLCRLKCVEMKTLSCNCAHSQSYQIELSHSLRFVLISCAIHTICLAGDGITRMHGSVTFSMSLHRKIASSFVKMSLHCEEFNNETDIFDEKLTEFSFESKFNHKINGANHNHFIFFLPRVLALRTIQQITIYKFLLSH